MRILVVGGGGREHAIVDALARSPKVERLWCAPGNPGIAQLAECVSIPADNLRALAAFARDNHVTLTMVGPEAPLVQGLVDYFRTEGLQAVGPTKQAARLEGSKCFAKEFMQKYGIPTARYDVIPNLEKGAYQLNHWTGRSVVKADGLAAGKGVKVCENQAEAKAFLYEVMEKEIFGAAGSTVLIEECLEGEEATIMAFCDGKTLVPMPASQDHKRLLDNDGGPNTGGMGAYAPAPVVTPELYKEIDAKIFKPFLKGIQGEKFDFRGIIYFGLMLTAKGPQVLEFNVRFGDPETEVVLPLLESDLSEILEAVADQMLSKLSIRWKKYSALCVVLASQGYPGAFEKGKLMHGLPNQQTSSARVYHAGTTVGKQGIETSGGRVVAVTGIAPTLEGARDKAYASAEAIRFEGKTFRKDIGARAMKVAGRSA